MREISDALPGADLIREGLRDLERGVESVPALLVLVGAPRLRDLGLDVPDRGGHPEHRLYDLLAADDPDEAHSRYNALIRRLGQIRARRRMGRVDVMERRRPACWSGGVPPP